MLVGLDLVAFFQRFEPGRLNGGKVCEEIFATAVGRPDLIMPIIAGIGEVDSAEPSHAMWALSRLDPDSQEFADQFAAFLYEYGSRGPNEWESRSPSWETRPALALAAIDRMRQAPDSANPAGHHAERATEREAASATLLAMVEGDPATHGQDP